MNNSAPEVAVNSVLKPSDKMADDSPIVKGYDFNNGLDYDALIASYKLCGFQATNFGKAVDEINNMITRRFENPPKEGQKTNCMIFLGFTSNMISSGIRETIRYLAEHSMVDCIVTSAGGIEEDYIKCFAPTFIGDFTLKGAELRHRGMNRIGNLIVPNDNYCTFENWLTPILDQMLHEQKTEKINWTPSKLIDRLGKEINDPKSVYHWCHKNKIPVFCPAITDGSIGDILYFHSYKNPGLVLDIVEDIRRMNNQVVFASNSGIIILGGGLCKHHICNANMMRNGADFSVFLNTAQEFDGSDSGARPDEAVSWGKIKATATPVKVYAEATLVFPLLVAETFVKNYERKKRELEARTKI
ncbi:deoxyhypusine synthase-like [Xenia sp. Carnegie-2017]|uniref:deoxyhypusine synthase-like n=1 Tax=Xenia sp. Carnegie-2017 TaxID=2897299 RepID=UPI001F04F3ED|nr:deoxyhypusine synthase-like [Xenia sp. Carnegie-2017]